MGRGGAVAEGGGELLLVGGGGQGTLLVLEGGDDGRRVGWKEGFLKRQIEIILIVKHFFSCCMLEFIILRRVSKVKGNEFSTACDLHDMTSWKKLSLI